VFGVGSSLLVRDIDSDESDAWMRSRNWHLAAGPKAGAALSLLTNALAAVQRSGMEQRMTREYPGHAFVTVHGRSRQFMTWLYVPGRPGYTRVWGHKFSEEEFRNLMEV